VNHLPLSESSTSNVSRINHRADVEAQKPVSPAHVSGEQFLGAVLTTALSSYPTTWNSPQMPVPASGTGAYPTTTIAAEPFPKMSLSGAGNFTAEPQEIPLQQTSMPPVHLSLAAHDQPPAPIRTQYAYVSGSSAPPPQLSLPTAGDSSLSVPRYVDSNPRAAKSPRHASHQSVHSAGSISNNDTSNEYRYGPPYVGVNNNSSDMSPPQQGQSGFGSGAPDTQASTQSGSTTAPPPRDYFPPTTSWTSTAGDSNVPAYSNGESRPYAFPDHYKTGSSAKPETAASQGYTAPRGSFDTMHHYSWNAA
jgi:hypothetical protein